MIMAVFTYLSGAAQVQFSGGPSYLKGSGYYDNHAYLLGGNISAKYVIQERFLIGATFRGYQANTTAYENYNASDKQQSFVGSFDVVFNRLKKVRPYVGVDAGTSQTSHMINYIRVNRSDFIAGGRFGTFVSLGQSTGFFGQITYNYTPGNGNPSTVQDITNPILTEPIGKYFVFDAGLFIRLYVRVKQTPK